MFTKFLLPAVAASGILAASSALACYGNACTGGGSGGDTWSPSFEMTGGFAGFTANDSFGFGDQVNTGSFANEMFSMETFGEIVGDPNCTAECGDTTFGFTFSSSQNAGGFSEAFSSGSGQVGSGAFSTSVGGVHFGGSFTADGM